MNGVWAMQCRRTEVARLSFVRLTNEEAAEDINLGIIIHAFLKSIRQLSLSRKETDIDIYYEI